MIILALVLSACRGSAPPSAAPAAAPGSAAAPGAAALTGAAAPATGAPAGEPAPMKLIISHAAMSPGVSPVWVAADLEFGRRYGVDIEIKHMRNVTMSQAALLSGEIDYTWTSFGPTLASNNAGSDVVLIGATQNRTGAEFVTRPGLTLPDGLRGAKIGVQSLGGGPPQVRALATLLRFGLDPVRDNVTVIATGEEPTTVSAFMAGVVDAAPLSWGPARLLEKEGYGTMPLGPLGVFDTLGIVTRDQRVRDQPEMTRRLLQAVAASIAYIHTIPSDAEARQRVTEAVAKRLSASTDTMDLQIESFAPLFPLNMEVELEGAHQIKGLMAELEPAVASASVERAINQSIREQLQREGFFDSLAAR
jgi:ABC-type nitrate/sulfonate/bicarbonate transport system substrate-binding protein